MLFNSLSYLVFLVLTVGLYRLLGRRGQNLLLLIASYVFYGFWDYRFLSLIVVSTVVDYLVALGLERSREARHRRWLLVTSLVVNLGILGFFKYFDFFVASARDLLGELGLSVAPPLLEVVLPVGISFYTFQTLSYTIGVYRGTSKACRSPLTFAVFVAFFPQLVAGPIERAEHLIPQLERPRPPLTAECWRTALLLILSGLLKKVVIADTAATLANRAFGNPEKLAGAALLLGVYAFAVQIYGDFSGYTDIARGSARLFGIELMRNFEQPYLSRNVTEFWRRWHISLSTWLRDYLYIPLGGSRGGKLETYRNLMIVMLLGGLWHGAAWTFVVWGGLHGLWLALHRWWRGSRRDAPGDALDWRRDLLPILSTFHLVCLSWVFFRADSFGTAWTMIQRIATLAPGDWPIQAMVLPPTLAAILMLDLAARRGWGPEQVARWEPALQGALAGAVIAGLALFWGAHPQPFVYFQF